MKVIAVDDWSESNKMKFKEYWKYLSDIAENDEKIFFKGDRFIREKRLMTKILMKAQWNACGDDTDEGRNQTDFLMACMVKRG